MRARAAFSRAVLALAGLFVLSDCGAPLDEVWQLKEFRVLGVRLEKADTYVLGAEGEPATAATLTAARRLVSLAALFAGLAALLLTLLGSPARGVWEPLGWPW